MSALKSDPGKVGLETLLVEVEKLVAVRSVGVSDDVFAQRSEKLVEAWRARAIRMYPSDFADTQPLVAFEAQVESDTNGSLSTATRIAAATLVGAAVAIMVVRRRKRRMIPLA